MDFSKVKGLIAPNPPPPKKKKKKPPLPLPLIEYDVISTQYYVGYIMCVSVYLGERKCTDQLRWIISVH